MRFKKQNVSKVVIDDDMTVFNRQTPVPTHVPYGNRRVYTVPFRKQWVEWERDNGMTGPNGEVLTCYRPYDNGRGSKRRRLYYDTSMAHIDLQYIDQIQPFDPVNTKYMNKHYLGGVKLSVVAHMATNDFLRHIESLPCSGKQTRYGGKKSKHRI